MTPIYSIRPIQQSELTFLRDMLYEAMAVAPEVRAMGKEKALELPVSHKYLDGLGRAGDVAVIAIDEQQRGIGAAWYRLFPTDAPGYGFVAPDIPEITIGVRADARGQGAGGALLQALLEAAHVNGLDAISLSVDRKNPALKLYERYGFRDAGVSLPDDSSVTMIRKFP